MLVGLVTAALPLAIHLLNRSRTPPVPFSNLEFLRRLHHSRMRRVRLRQWLVLLLRTLIILLIVCAFARPAYLEGGSGLLGHTRPTAAVALIDRSFSTTYRLPEGRIFDLLRARAQELGAFFHPRDRLFLVPFALTADGGEAAPDAAAFVAALEQLTPSEEATDLDRALTRAGEILIPLEPFSGEVYLFSDMTASAWTDLVDRQQWLPEAKIFVVSPSSAARPNPHVERLEVNSWMAVPGTKLEARFEVGNSSTRSVEAASLDLFVDGQRVGHRTASLPAGRSISASIPFVPARAGDLAGYLELEDDRLTLDNRRYVSFSVADSIRVLILGGNPNDTYYPRRGLAAAASEDLALVVESGLFSDLDAALLESVQVLLLCNLEHLDRETVALLHRFVADGGGLVIFPSPQADLSFFNRRLLPGLMPLAITGVTGDPTDQSGYQRLTTEGSDPLVHQLLPDLPADRPPVRGLVRTRSSRSAHPIDPFRRGAVGNGELLEGTRAHGAFGFPIVAELERSSGQGDVCAAVASPGTLVERSGRRMFDLCGGSNGAAPFTRSGHYFLGDGGVARRQALLVGAATEWGPFALDDTRPAEGGDLDP